MTSRVNCSPPRLASSRSENQISGKKPPSSAAGKQPPQQQEQTLKCPRCNSSNTKFCYYNNYSLSQPRHFCKTCRRYWTRGGALRNVPVGGGCRKAKRSIVSNSSSSSINCSISNSSILEGSSKIFNGFVSPGMDFQVAGLSLNNIVNINPNIETNNNLHLSSSSSSPFLLEHQTTTGLSLMGFGDCSINNQPAFTGAASSVGVEGSLASSIETLSSLNQDLHWKLQQERMATLFGSKETKNGTETVSNDVVERPQPILFRNLEMNSSTREECGENQTEWYFGNSAYTSDNSNIHVSGSTASDWNGVQAWTDLNHYSTLP